MNKQLDTLRVACAERIYVETLMHQNGDKIWSRLPLQIRAGYERMVATVFDELFRKDPIEMAEFFTDGKVPDVISGLKVKRWDAAQAIKKTNLYYRDWLAIHQPNVLNQLIEWEVKQASDPDNGAWLPSHAPTEGEINGK